MKKKSLLIINKLYYPFLGGVETVAKQYAEWAKSSSYNVTVLCMSDNVGDKSSIEIIDGIKVVRVSSFYKFNSLPLSVEFFYTVFSLVKRHDIIHAHYPFPLFDLVFPFLPKNKKYIVTWHSDIIRQKLLNFFLKPFTRFMIKRVLVTTTSPILARNSTMLKNIQAKVLPLSISEPIISDDYSCPSFDSTGRKIPDNFALFLGRFSYYKGIDFLLKACVDHLPQTHNLLLVGNGEMSSYVKRVIKENNLDNVFLIDKHVSENEKHAIMRKCRFFLFPSILPSEAFGITQLEAMSHGRPVINTHLKSGVPWVSIHNETGLTVDVGDSKGLAKSISLLFEDEELYRRLSSGAIKRAAYFSSENIRNQYLTLLNTL